MLKSIDLWLCQIHPILPPPLLHAAQSLLLMLAPHAPLNGGVILGYAVGPVMLWVALLAFFSYKRPVWKLAPCKRFIVLSLPILLLLSEVSSYLFSV